VPHCERCDAVLEPIVSNQWFVSMKPLAKPAVEAMRQGEVRIVPERFTKVYYEWMENIRDWPISRQLWWGHRIPVWHCEKGHLFSSAELPEKVTRCEICGGTAINQDSDVLDTWFSSGLWPFSTLGWPTITADYKYFYPTDVMETGYDILFFWVARMIFQGIENTGQVPFHTVYLHGLVRDDKGQKMSKSKGNVVNPLEMADKYGADALRMALVTNSSPGNDQKLTEQRIEQAGHFANKLWNATRFVLGSATESKDNAGTEGTGSLADRWITSRFNSTAAQVTQLLEDYQLGEAGKVLQEFVWNEYCDWYIEAAKTGLRSEDAGTRAATSHTARAVLEGILRLLHPYMPFLTEELWQNLNSWPCEDESLPAAQRSIMKADWTTSAATDREAELDFNLVIDIIRQIRNARAEAVREAPEKVKKEMTGRRIEALIAGGTRTTMLRNQADTLALLARLDPEKLRIEERISERPAQSVNLVVGEAEVVLPLAGLVDMEAERKRLQNEAEATKAEIERTEALLSNEGFVGRAPANVVQQARDKLTAAQERLIKLQERLDSIEP
ncbi:MAG: class I tRNA ligase family protein, partial [Chloroflexota bacterium]|nr:class I tRNA ligase family protein [Chloroflexota bacterium]